MSESKPYHEQIHEWYLADCARQDIEPSREERYLYDEARRLHKRQQGLLKLCHEHNVPVPMELYPGADDDCPEIPGKVNSW